MKNKFGLVSILLFVLAVPAYLYAVTCNNGIKEGIEQCDNGPNNSDTLPDKCRTDCSLPHCGDWVTDSAEECDEGPDKNSNVIPNACRKNCKQAHCGDGVLDFAKNEICDDGNNNAYDGCHQCRPCHLPKDNLVLSGNNDINVRLCHGKYEFRDQGQEGIIILSRNGMTLDCQGATLVGLPPAPTNPISGTNIPNVAKILKKGKRLGGKFARKKAPSTAQPSQGNAPNLPQTPRGYRGTGIIVTAQNVVIRNCNIEGFKVGVKLPSTGGVLIDNNICGNGNNDVISQNSENYGLKNKCSKHTNWRENGAEGCMAQCEG